VSGTTDRPFTDPAAPARIARTAALLRPWWRKWAARQADAEQNGEPEATDG
jgi:hypothetical protein